MKTFAFSAKNIAKSCQGSLHFHFKLKSGTKLLRGNAKVGLSNQKSFSSVSLPRFTAEISKTNLKFKLS